MQATQQQILWTGAGLGLVALYLYQRQQAALAANDPQAGTGFVQGAVDYVDVLGTRIVNLLMSRGYRNNNPGNIRFISGNPFNGQISNDGGYGVYDTPQNGTRALGHQLMNYANRGLDTVQGIIQTWAPAADSNNVPAYVSTVSSELSLDPNQPINVNARLPDLAQAIARHENGYVDSAYDWQWVYL